MTTVVSALPIESRAKQNYCEYSEHRILFFIDRTTEYDERDQRLFAKGLEQIFDSISIGNEVILHTINDEYTASQQSFRACYPGCPKTGLLGWVFGTCKSMEARGDRLQFKSELAHIGRQILNEKQYFSFSDIAATIASVSKSYTSQSKSVSRIYIFSDMIENSKAFPWPTVLKLNPSALVDELEKAGIKPQVYEATVDIFGFGRSHNKQRRTLTTSERQKLLEFWTGFFKALGVRNVRIGEQLP